MSILLRNIKIITPSEVLIGYEVLVKQGKITKIDLQENMQNIEFDEIIDGKGQYLSPGFIDIHNHGNSGYDFMDSTIEAIDSIGKYHLQNGVTSYLGTVLTQSYENIVEAVKNIANYENKENSSQILGIHLEGPFFSHSKKGAQPDKFIRDPDIIFIKELIKISDNKLKMVSIAPEKDGALELIRYLKEKNVAVSMAHSNATYEEAMNGINNGVTISTHLYNGMRSFNHREPGIVGASLTDDRVCCELICDRIHLHDAAIKLALKAKGTDKAVLVSDAMRAAGLKDGEFELGGQKVMVINGEARLSDGSLAGSTLNLNKAVYNMVKFLNVPIHEAVKMASLSPARAIGVHVNKGSIEVGKDADMLLLDDNVNVSCVIKGGNVIFKK
ncbi:MAG: N-acetylglucosamine-6-phosphate deacetylase [Sedimentibacter saalensis]|uniref:N-acetylglucosamine-6-phosphate deacetylase n=1 Tax=Sedimentibacter saalensis TaxID=130788 RepID=UPI002B1FB355|nr:N-acetylglucosamine-6-phosphate deacetylase [Sedimentibacter saalensis]MEA5093830.1 N-acetylglucosamine-6-phosphate deacetylase [Sedimentibacter saalensis]